MNTFPHPPIGTVEIMLGLISEEPDSVGNPLHLQREAIGLIDADLPTLVAFVETLTQECVSLQIIHHRILTSTESHQAIKVDLIQEAPTGALPADQPSEIATRLFDRFGPWLAGPAPWVFRPQAGPDLLFPKETPITCVLRQTTDLNDASSGSALVLTPSGRVSVVKEPGYLRATRITID